jgi:hypothetical protein
MNFEECQHFVQISWNDLFTKNINNRSPVDQIFYIWQTNYVNIVEQYISYLHILKRPIINLVRDVLYDIVIET